MTVLVLAQSLHVLAAVVWGGGQILTAVAIWPAVLRMPVPEGRALIASLGPVLGPLMGVSGMVLILAGIARGVWAGPVQSLSVLVTTSYGQMFSASIVLTVGLAVHGARTPGRLERLFEGDHLHPHAGRRLQVDGALVVLTITAIVGCMVGMRLGL